MSTVYTFEWPRACKGSVYVTGTFDDWSKSTRMVKGSTGKYTATLEIPKDKKILFKFVVDGSWVTIPEFRVERDASGIDNNVLYPEDITHHDEELVSVLAEGGHNFDSPQFGPNDTNATAVHSESETTTSFSNVSAGEFSPFEHYEGTPSGAINTFALSGGADDEDADMENISDDLVSSAQITLSGGTEPMSGIPDGSNRPTLVNIQEGKRQVRYFTSMSLLTKFTDYFK